MRDERIEVCSLLLIALYLSPEHCATDAPMSVSAFGLSFMSDEK